ncbi:helix-turn-helix domain-containing protein [Glutamicibacter creatinolyticus]|uniref:helix-turn-helix domain-containing protein n=1 Tax=Glutamicibacter TaxID=1742989 RepID=UPI0037BFE108
MTRRTDSYATTEDLAAEYGISVVTVQRRASDGSWPAGKVGNRYRFSPEQQDEIRQIVLGNHDSRFDKTRIADALRRIA